MDDSDVARLWDGNAEVWARHVRAGYDTYRDLFNNPAFLEFAGDLQGQAVLDAGCGEGHNTRLLARAGARMTGADLSERMIALAREEEERDPLGIGYEVASMSDMPMFSHEAFDAVVSTMALMDCADYEGPVTEFWRVLRPGGMLAFSLLHPCYSYFILDWEYGDDGEVASVRVGPYFREREKVLEWKFGAAPDSEEVEPFTGAYFHRTMAELINPPCATGFRLEGVAEPRPTEEACRADPRLRKHRLIPATLCVKARKA
jgi:ubiquinone/menaquinone biosynthesis C-methylase UbiE